MGDYAWPQYYSFPPFFTLQPNDATRAKQLSLWAQLIADWCKQYKKYFVDAEARENLYKNPEISRELSQEAISEVEKYLAAEGIAVKLPDGRLLIPGRKVSDWADAIYAWVVQAGRLNAVETLYSLYAGDETTSEEFYGLPPEVVLEAVRHLAKSKRAELFESETDPAMTGVKFFP